MLLCISDPAQVDLTMYTFTNSNDRQKLIRITQKRPLPRGCAKDVERTSRLDLLELGLRMIIANAIAVSDCFNASII